MITTVLFYVCEHIIISKTDKHNKSKHDHPSDRFLYNFVSTIDKVNKLICQRI